LYPNNTNNRTDIALSGGTQVSDHWSAEASVKLYPGRHAEQPAQAYEEIDPMQGFIWFGRQVDVEPAEEQHLPQSERSVYAADPRRNPLLRTDAPIPYSWNYSYHPSPYWMTNVKTTDYGRNRGLGHASGRTR